MTVIKCENISKTFDLGEVKVEALREVNLAIEEGEFVSIMGTSGSGKSTFLNIIGCLDQKFRGTYMLDNIYVNGLEKSKLATIRNQKIGFIFQAYNLLQRTTAYENVELPLLYCDKSLSAKVKKGRIIEKLEAVGLTDRMYHYPNQLSGGQQQRVAIARALINDPSIILADEPTGNLDTKTSYEIIALLQSLNRKGKTIIMVTHEEDIAKFTKRKIIFRDGAMLSSSVNTAILDANSSLAAFKKSSSKDEYTQSI